MKSEILRHLRNYRNGSTKLRNILDIHDKIIKLKTDNRIISQRINDLIDFPKPYGGLGLYIPQLKNSQVNILNKKDATLGITCLDSIFYLAIWKPLLPQSQQGHLSEGAQPLRIHEPGIFP